MTDPTTALARQIARLGASPHWTSGRKALVLEGVRQGLLTEIDTGVRWGIAMPELREWQEVVDRRGLAGLRVTHATRYRDKEGATQTSRRARQHV